MRLRLTSLCILVIAILCSKGLNSQRMTTGLYINAGPAFTNNMDANLTITGEARYYLEEKFGIGVMAGYHLLAYKEGVGFINTSSFMGVFISEIRQPIGDHFITGMLGFGGLTGDFSGLMVLPGTSFVWNINQRLALDLGLRFPLAAGRDLPMFSITGQAGILLRLLN
jgi:hypothetical protein